MQRVGSSRHSMIKRRVQLKVVINQRISQRNYSKLQTEPKYLDLIRNLFNSQYKFLQEKFANLDEPYITIEIQRVKSVCNIFTYFLKSILVQKSTDLPKQITSVFAYSCVFGLFASYKQKYNVKMGLDIIIYILLFPINYYFRLPHMLKTNFNHYSTRKVIPSFICMLMEMILLHFNHEYLNYKNFNLQKINLFFSIVVQTLDTLKFKYIIQLLIKEQKNTLITGQTGVGKSMLVQQLLYEMKLNEKVQPVLLNFQHRKNKANSIGYKIKINQKGKNTLQSKSK
ncbi:unnamed protein product [Paramecium pentaurelia]|uniref:Uncharacterized protein n=1 Tax=Paramecium pentaurelia TaxID=43138 RepID=A0A8S1WHX3_9CILI|nr:unnamed protein product [Paramecium pentaurelia]